MAAITDLRLAALTRTARELKSNLVRLRKAKLCYGSCRLSPDEQSKLTSELKTVQGDLDQAVAKYAPLATTDDELSRYLDLARDVLRDCNEILNLLL